jgi:hypothetical protein
MDLSENKSKFERNGSITWTQTFQTPIGIMKSYRYFIKPLTKSVPNGA